MTAEVVEDPGCVARRRITLPCTLRPRGNLGLPSFVAGLKPVHRAQPVGLQKGLDRPKVAVPPPVLEGHQVLARPVGQLD